MSTKMSTTTVTTKIFISHRPEDSGAVVRHLHDRLAEAFGADNVLMEAGGAPPPGEVFAQLPDDFATELAERVSRCGVLLAVIGPDWLGARDAAGVPRTGRRNDLVTVAIAAATARNIRIVPVLVDGAAMPPADALPDSLLPLAWREAFVFRDPQADADRLVEMLRADAPARRLALAPGLLLRRINSFLQNFSLRGLPLCGLSLRHLSLRNLAAFAAGLPAEVAARVRAVPLRIVVAIPAGAVVVLLAAALTDRFATGSPPPEPGRWQVPAGFSAADFRAADRPPACDDSQSAPQPVPINAGGAANLALLKQAKAFASSLLPDSGLRHQAAYLIDGWYDQCRSWVPATMPAWVEVDLGEIFRLKGVKLGSEHMKVRGDRAPSAFSIAIRADASNNWNVVYEQPANRAPLLQTMEFAFPSPRPAQYVRIDISATRDGDLPRLDEFEIYGQRR
jgi:F5/8 type C domain/TIR domain